MNRILVIGSVTAFTLERFELLVNHLKAIGFTVIFIRSIEASVDLRILSLDHLENAQLQEVQELLSKNV